METPLRWCDMALLYHPTAERERDNPSGATKLSSLNNYAAALLHACECSAKRRRRESSDENTRELGQSHCTHYRCTVEAADTLLHRVVGRGRRRGGGRWLSVSPWTPAWWAWHPHTRAPRHPIDQDQCVLSVHCGWVIITLSAAGVPLYHCTNACAHCVPCQIISCCCCCVVQCSHAEQTADFSKLRLCLARGCALLCVVAAPHPPPPARRWRQCQRQQSRARFRSLLSSSRVRVICGG